MNKISKGSLGFALMTMVLSLGCSSEKPASAPTPEIVRDVPVAAAQRTKVPANYEAMGTVRAVQTAQVASQIMGNLVRVNAREGDRVHRGQVLAVVDGAQMRAGVEGATAGVNASQQAIAAAESDYALAESTQQRYQSLFDKKSVSPQEFDEVKSRFASAKARRDAALAGRSQAESGLSQARNSQGFTQIRAPFDGVVAAKLAETGALAVPGTPIFVVEDTSRFRLEVTVDESALGAVRIGAPVAVSVDAFGNETVKGKIVQIVPAADAASRTFVVKIDLPTDARMRSGLFGRARFALGERESLTVPQTALVQRGTMQGVYVLGDNQVATLRYVTLGRANGVAVEVLSGLEQGDRFVTAPGSRELNGKKLEVR